MRVNWRSETKDNLKVAISLCVERSIQSFLYVVKIVVIVPVDG